MQANFSSPNAQFDGQTLNLEGKLILSHPLGTLSSDKASIIREQERQKNTLFNSVLLEKKVRLELATGGILNSEAASYDMESQKIEFFKRKHKISFSDRFKNQDGTFLPFSIQSDRAYTNPLSFTKTAAVPFNFADNVKINIDNKIKVYGNEAVCVNDKISLYPKSQKAFCKAIYCKKTQNTNSLSSNKTPKDLKLLSKFLEFDLATSDLYLEKSQGKIKEQISFSSDKLYFNKKENKLTLDQNAVLKNDNFSLSCNLLDIYLFENKPQTALCSNATKIIFNNEKHSKISCLAPVIFNFEKNTASTCSTNNECSFCYEDDDFLIFSNQADLLLEKSSNPFKITGATVESAILEKEVIFISKRSDENYYFGIADKLTYNPANNLITLESFDGKKVLFLKNDNSQN